MVETEVSLYTVNDPYLDMDKSLLNKGDHANQLQDIDQHSAMPVDSPRVSSTPPSTPGLDSIQDKETKEQEDDDDEADDLDEYNNYGYDEYLIDYESEQDEDYFFKDFAATSPTSCDTSNNTTNTRSPKSKRYSRRQRSQKVMSRFDLQSFARQLHANRLSVLQTRQSRMILTEEDERELDKLLARKYSHDSTTSLSTTTPPVPALPVPASLPQSSSTPLDNSSLTTPTSSIEKEQQKATVIEPSFSNLKQKTVMVESTSDMAGPISRLSNSSESHQKPSLLLQKLNNQHPSFRSKDASFIEVAPLSPSLSDPSSFTSPRRAPTPPAESPSSPSTSASSTTEKSLTFQPATTVTLSPAPATFTVKKKSSWITKTQKTTAISPLNAPQPRKSMSVDTLRDQARPKETWKMAPAKTTKIGPTKSTKAIPINTLPPALEDTKKTKLRLFGSLRQASRSSRAAGEGAIRGLMRNLSTVGQRQQSTASQQQSQEQDDPSLTDSTSMSRAARAVIQHDVSNNKKTKPANSASQELDPTMMEGMDDTTVQVTHTATSTKGGVRLLSNLLAKARSRRSAKKTTNVQSNDNNDQTGSDTKERNKVVRRTIIYVQPDALDFMKDGHLPPIPAPKNRHLENADDDDHRFSKDTFSDDTIEYATATKVTRQVSRRKRLVEEPSEQQPQMDITTLTKQNSQDGNNHKKWRLESVSELNVNTKDTDDLYQDSNGSLEGLELREMSDGSVVWGIVKKQGNRKSFFASKALGDRMMKQLLQQEEEDAEREHDQIEKSVLALMGLEPDSLENFSTRLSGSSSTSQTSIGPRDAKKTMPPPIPKRSPRRKCQDAGDDSKRLQRGLSVEEQLDEMMLSIKQAQL